ncbi:molybdopterin-binding domain of aldehyde dehydrogenase domain-containing protein [Phthorimaea operculella]|nr:molybdopterin-binding domain of aldehyde dehydrogenase domain-containing protein [Phthorimaea operculella]
MRSQNITANISSVGSEISSDLTLVDYIRNHAEFRGTKYMCREGGCGACIVSVVKKPGEEPAPVNSCLVSVTSCQDWEITTVEKVGNKLDGYDPVQTTLAQYNGTQCGYCTPGWIMAMYSIKESKRPLTKLDIEKAFASNICRCTGYRPILEAFKTFATADEAELQDIEDLRICKKNGTICNKEKCEGDEWCLVTGDDVKPQIFEINLKDGRKWFRVKCIPDIFQILKSEGDDSYMLVAGNTSKGVMPISEYPRILIDISTVPELRGWSLDQNLVVGGAVTLKELLDIFKHMGQEEYFTYLQNLYDHTNLVAHAAVRNLGTIAGNLMMKHKYARFPSDIFLLFETIGAQITIMNAFGMKRVLTMQQFLQANMRSNVIVNVLIPPLSDEYKLVVYKIMPRAQNSKAMVNAGFLFKLSALDSTVQEARIVFGNISGSFIRANKTESYLIGKNLFKNETLQSAIRTLKDELDPVEAPPEPSPEFRKQLATNLFYKALLSLCPQSKLGSRYRSGTIRLKDVRPVSEGRQIYDTDPSLWPINQPIPKLEALIQCSGEAQYSEDLPSFPKEVFAAFVLSTVASATIQSINPDKALAYPGVVAFYSAKDIPGENTFTPWDTTYYPVKEELLADKEVQYYNQPIGIIVAETRAIADRAAQLVEVKYTNIKTPVIDIEEAIKDPSRNKQAAASSATETGSDVKKVIKGKHTVYGQYHFTMETLVCVTKPTEEGLEVHAATQWMDGVQEITAKALNMDSNKVDVRVRRVGGAYGIKIARSSQVAIACSMVAKLMNRPCRFIQSLTTNMKAVGKRLPCINQFEVAVNEQGVIQYNNYDIYEDNGYIVNEPFNLYVTDAYNNCYSNARWNFKIINTVTNTPSNTWCRSPGTLESIAFAEILMERISYEMSLDPLEVRLRNVDETKYTDVRSMAENLKSTAKYNERRAAVNKFNEENRWKKRGLRFSISRWSTAGVQYLNINVSVYHGDGTVAITHCGIEMGQGVNTKAAQVAAYLLKIPLEKVQIKPNDTIIAPNGFISGASLTSQSILAGIQNACEELLQRLEPARKELNNPTWEELVKKAFDMSINLQSQGFVDSSVKQTENIIGIALTEVEIDVLTGEFEVIRVDLLQDVGRSVSPQIDIGQIEGSFVMGLGYWTTEHLVYDQKTGELLSDRSWYYHVPQARDIPQDLRIYFKKNSYSTDQFFGAKATGEPPICLAVGITFALREAIAEARLEAGHPLNQWFDIAGPFTSEKICLACETNTEDFKFI